MNQDWKSLESSPFYLDNKWHLYTIVNDGTIGILLSLLTLHYFMLME